MSYDDILTQLDSNDSKHIKKINGKTDKERFDINQEIFVKEKKDDNEKEKSKREFITYKYSQTENGELHESILINDFPSFVRYNQKSGESETISEIEENHRILKPPEVNEYPYIPYKFESKKDLDFFIEKAKKITLDDLYTKCKSIFKRYIDQDEHIILLLAADSIWTYFQDLSAFTHYVEGIGTNDVGKSTIGYVFEYTGYRAIKATEISGANYYRVLGSIEPGQCVIIEDEGDSISEDIDKIRILKSGYEYNGKVPKINMNSKNQDQKWFKTYCYKMILAEESLSQSKAKGLVDRTFSFHCRPGDIKFYSIKEVTSGNISKNIKLQKLYDELLSFRKLMLCYRLIHYNDELSNIETGLKNRDNELCKPLLQLFYGTNALKEIIKTLEVFVNQRKERKSSSLEAALYPIIKKFVFSDSIKAEKKLVAVPYSMIWSYIINDGMEGFYDDKKRYQYETINYGVLYLNSLSKFIVDKFGAKLDKKRNGSILIFDIEKLKKFENVYGSQLKDTIKINVKPVIETAEEINEIEECDDCDDYEGSGERVSIENSDSKVENEHNSMHKNSIFDKEKNDTHTLESSQPSKSSQPSHFSSSSSSSLLDNLDNNKETNSNENFDLVELKSLVSPSVYADIWSMLEKEKNPQIREIIIHNSKNIKRKSPNSDVFTCLSYPKCKYADDIWSMIKHPCHNFYKQKKEKRK